MADYTQNSKPKAETTDSSTRPPVEKRVEKITTGTIKTKKKSEIRKFADVFIEDDINTVKTYIKNEILIPRVRQLLYDIGEGVLNAVFSGRRDRSRTTVDKVSYDKCYGGGRDDRRRDDYQPRAAFDYDTIRFVSRGDAEDVLDRLDEMIEQYGMARVGDIYDMIGKSCSYTAYNYGWTNLRDARVARYGSDYALDLPKAVPLNR
jgi:hypothetical protein